MLSIKFYRYLFIILLHILIIIDQTKCNNKTDNFWIDVGRMTGLLLHNCIIEHNINGPQELLLILQGCIKRRSLLILDKSLDRDVIQLTDGIELVKYDQGNDTTNRDLTIDDNEGIENDWKTQALQRITKLFNTHVLKIRFNDDNTQTEARHRRRRGMMSVLTFGMVALGAILIWMGFQLLAVLGGKALLLAKLALLLTSIQGLKKIATSNLNYGLYSVPQHGYWNYDRQWPYDVAGHESRLPFYYELPDQQTDLSPPLHPRIHSIKNKFDD